MFLDVNVGDYVLINRSDLVKAASWPSDYNRYIGTIQRVAIVSLNKNME